jgi:hypothetical protein
MQPLWLAKLRQQILCLMSLAFTLKYLIVLAKFVLFLRSLDVIPKIPRCDSSE